MFGKQEKTKPTFVLEFDANELHWLKQSLMLMRNKIITDKGTKEQKDYIDDLITKVYTEQVEARKYYRGKAR